MYQNFFKRVCDIFCGVLALTLLCWLYAIIALLVRINLGSPVIFKQIRPGKKDKNGQETLFKMYKFRTMTEEKDKDGKLLPDEQRLTKFGIWLRKTSLDEIPEAINILKGDMSVIGPRPQLVRDMVFMTKEQRERHTVKPGLSGLAQINGRNTISWEEKLAIDLEYIKHITFFGDLKIVFQTVAKSLKRDGLFEEGECSAADFGDYLLDCGKVDVSEYEEKQKEARELVGKL